jgi:hypothetical protein
MKQGSEYLLLNCISREKTGLKVKGHPFLR